MNWYYIDGPQRVGPLNETEWDELVRSGKILPETLVWHEGMDGRWLPYSQVAEPPPLEPDGELEAEPVEAEEEAPAAFTARVTDQDYPVSINASLSGAWKVFQSRMGLLVGSTLLAGVLLAVSSALPLLKYIVPMIFHGVLMGGLFLIYLRATRDEPTELGDLFAGFQPGLFMQLALQTLVSSTVWQVCFIPALIAMNAFGIDSSSLTAKSFQSVSDPQTAMVLLLVLLACSIPAVYFSFCWMFSIPLIVDRGLDFWPAMQLSRRKVLQHPWRIALLSLAAGIIAASGLLLLVVGVIITAPLYSLAMVQIYEKMFGPKTRL